MPDVQALYNACSGTGSRLNSSYWPRQDPYRDLAYRPDRDGRLTDPGALINPVDRGEPAVYELLGSGSARSLPGDNDSFGANDAPTKAVARSIKGSGLTDHGKNLLDLIARMRPDPWNPQSAADYRFNTSPTRSLV